MDSPPPTQVPLVRDSLLDGPRLPPPGSGSPTSAINSLGSPVHSSSGNTVSNNHHDSDPLVSMTNGLGGVGGHPPLSIAHAHAAALAAAQYHNQSLLAAAHARHQQVNPMNQLMRKNLMPKPGAPYPSPPPMGAGGENACKLIKYRERDVAAFMVDGRELICLPQAFELFLKDLVGGLHTVYTKLKRLDIQPVVCNVEQVRVLRGLGAIAPGVNRCKLISCSEFDVLYDDCTNSNARPGRPPKRSPSIHHASQETLDKLNKKREEMGFNFDPRYYGEPKSMLNGLPHHPWTPFSPYLHMGVNPMMTPPMSMALAASQFAMRADSAAASKDKPFSPMDHDIINRQSQERLASQLGMFGTPSLPPDHPLAPRHPDDAKPINLSNGHARELSHPVPSGKALSTDGDDDEDDVVNDVKHTDDENDPDLDDNSIDGNDLYNVSGREADKPAASDSRQGDPTPLNGGQLPPASQTPSELEDLVLNMSELAQKAVSLFRCSQRQSSLERGEMMSLLRENEATIQSLKRKLEEAESKNQDLRIRLKRVRKEKRLSEAGQDGPMPGSPSSAHNGNTTVPSGDLGLDLALKPACSPEEPTRVTHTDAGESEGEGDKAKGGPDRDREIKLTDPSERGSLRDSFDVFSAAAALSSGGSVTGGSPPVRFPAPYLSLIGSEVQ